ncbi:MAG TPA: DEAD/DEAH box helicase, partial [Verrucomicrobiales bacterium]|nr:DEAD/DEAH box helicase [Verrucomicrobiales bacterium]
TRQAIVSLKHLEPTGPYLVLCPASVKTNWTREILTVDAEAETTVISGGKTPSDEIQSGKGWLILNYDILNKHIDWIHRIEWKGILFDEAHFLKNHNSIRSRLARKLALEGLGDPVVYTLTGTPLTNRPRDLFVLLQLIRHPVGRSFISFAKRYCDAVKNDYGWVTDGASNLKELTLQLHGIMIRRRKEEVLDLPPKLRDWLEVEVPAGTASAETREVVASLIKANLRQSTVGSSEDGTNSGEIAGRDRGKLLAKLTKLRQKLAKAKVKSTLDLLEDAVEQGEKVLVFSCFDSPIKTIQKRFGDKCLMLTGTTPPQKRQGLVDRFQTDENIQVFAANIIAGGIGLNLTAARHVVFNDLDWVPANHFQAEDRAYRIGQTATVNVHYLVASGTIDEFVRTVLAAKTALVEAVTEGSALDFDATGDILGDLEKLLGQLSPRLADTQPDEVNDDWIQKLLREVTQEVEGETQKDINSRKSFPLSEEALNALARVLAGPAERIFQAKSSKGTGSYTLTEHGADITCSCPGFEYRGTCRHSRWLK